MSEQLRVTSRCDVAHSGRENLHQFLPILLWRHDLSSSIMTLWWAELNAGENSLHWQANILPLFSIMTLWLEQLLIPTAFIIKSRIYSIHTCTDRFEQGNHPWYINKITVNLLQYWGVKDSKYIFYTVFLIYKYFLKNSE